MTIIYLGTTDVGVMVAKQMQRPTVMIRRSDARAPVLNLPHIRQYLVEDAPTNGQHYPNWQFDPLTLFCTETNEEAVEVIKALSGHGPGFFAVAIDAEGEIITSTYER